MSHFTRVKTILRDQVVLEDALRSLHYEFRSGERVPIRGYQGNREYGQVVVQTGSDYDIGFQRQDDRSFSACADWDYGIRYSTKLRQESFLQEVSRAYSHLAVRRQVQEQGFVIEQERVLETGEIEIVVSQPL